MKAHCKRTSQITRQHSGKERDTVDDITRRLIFNSQRKNMKQFNLKEWRLKKHFTQEMACKALEKKLRTYQRMEKEWDTYFRKREIELLCNDYDKKNARK